MSEKTNKSDPNAVDKKKNKKKKKAKEDKNPKDKKPFYKKKAFYVILAISFVLVLFLKQLEAKLYYTTMPVNHFELMVEHNYIKKVEYDEGNSVINYKVSKKGIELSRKYFIDEKKKDDPKVTTDDYALRQAVMATGNFVTKVPYNFFKVKTDIYDKLIKKGTSINMVSASNPMGYLGLIFYVVLIGLIGYSLFSTLNIGGRSKLEKIEETEYRFTDIAGLESVKKELQHIVYLLKNREKVKGFVEQIPKGILFEGSPGNGKTLLAKALAGESGVSFFYISASDIEGKFVGEGANRIANIFKKIHADIKENGSAILFIDELDAVGMNRNNRTVSETNQTLNKLLTELDGFNDAANLLVVGATNLASSLDPALVRSGRFDRIIKIPNPSERDRKAILKLYLDKNKEKVDPSVFEGDFLDTLSLQTSGFSSSDLSRIVNDALLICLTEDIDNQTPTATITTESSKDTMETHDKALTETIENNKDLLVREEHLRESYLRVAMGLPVVRDTSDTSLQVISWHESAHAIIAMATSTDGYNAVAYGTVRPYGDAGGFIHFVQSSNRLTRKSDYESRILTLLAGRTIEEIILDGDITDGASNDLEQVHNVIRAYVAKVGMSEGLENFYNEKTDSKKVSDAVDALAQEFSMKCRELVKRYYTEIEELANYFYDGNDLDRKDIVERYAEKFPPQTITLVSALSKQVDEVTPVIELDVTPVSTEEPTK